jgi:hypothetical protein
MTLKSIEIDGQQDFFRCTWGQIVTVRWMMMMAASPSVENL